MPGIKGRSGGKRPGAGRPKAYRFDGSINRADKYIAPRLKDYLELLEKLAKGQAEVVKEIWKPAALLLVEKTTLVVDEEGKSVPVRVKEGAFPTLRPLEMVLVEKRIETPLPDRSALIYLVNRIMGRPAGQPDDPETQTVLANYDLSKLAAGELETLLQLLEKASREDPAAPATTLGGAGR